MTLADVFPEADYRFHLRFERGSFREFFRSTAGQKELLAQRRHWLQTAPQTYAALLPDGIPPLEETINLALAEQTLPASFSPPGDSSPSHQSATPKTQLPPSPPSCRRLLELGTAWEPDFLLLKPNSEGEI